MEQYQFPVGLTEHSQRLSMTGMEFVGAMGNKTLPMPPMAESLPVIPHSFELGIVEFRATSEDRFANPMHTTHGGCALSMIDTATAMAAYTTLKRGESLVTLDTSGKFIRPITPKLGELRIIGKVISRGRTIITIEGRIEDLNGKIYVYGNSTCQIIS